MGKLFFVIVYLALFIRIFCLVDLVCEEKLRRMEIENNIEMANRIIVSNLQKNKKNRKEMSVFKKEKIELDFDMMAFEYSKFINRYTSLLKDMHIEYKIFIIQDKIIYYGLDNEIAWIDIIDSINENSYSKHNIAIEYNKKIEDELNRKINRFLYNKNLDINIKVSQKRDSIICKVLYIYYKEEILSNGSVEKYKKRYFREFSIK